MSTRIGTALVSAAILLSSSALAADEPKLEAVDPSGKPNGYRPGLTTRYAIWFEGDTWHFRTTTAKDTKVFSGSMEIIGGKMVDLKPVSADKGKKNNKKNLDYANWTPDGTQLSFSFTTGTLQDGFDMKVSDKATAIKFALKIEGKEMADHIFIGAKNGHPKGATFYLPAKPGK
jgi:hypothetical protein